MPQKFKLLKTVIQESRLSRLEHGQVFLPFWKRTEESLYQEERPISISKILED